MTFITFSSLLFLLIISISCSTIFRKNPMIFITQGVIERGNVFPIHFSWYILNFTEGDVFFTHAMSRKGNYSEHFIIDSRTGSHELARGALEYADSLDQFCVLVSSIEGILKNNISCKSKIEWMYDRRDILGNFALPDLVIPGTHQSAAYAKWDYESMNDESLFSRWTLCQTKSIKSQLMDGIRYLDLRPSLLYKDGVKEYIITHKLFDLVSMDKVVKQINEFMDISRDIVIVSFKEFSKGFESRDDHQSFIKYLEHSFEKHAHPRDDWLQELEKFWAADKRLILSYDDPSYELSNLTWPPIIQWWSNAQSINRLHSGLAELYQNITFPFDAPHAAVVELTHSLTTIAQDVFQRDMSLRHWGERVGRYIPQWYIEEWENSASIIAVDFYQTSGIVDLAIQLTEKRLRDRGVFDVVSGHLTRSTAAFAQARWDNLDVATQKIISTSVEE